MGKWLDWISVTDEDSQEKGVDRMKKPECKNIKGVWCEGNYYKDSPMGFYNVVYFDGGFYCAKGNINKAKEKNCKTGATQMIKKPDKPEFVGVRYDRHPMFDAGVSVGKREIYDKYEAYHNQYREAVERAVEDTTQMAL